MNQLPQQLLQSLQHIKGFDEAAFTAVHQSGEQVTSVRVNPGKFNAQRSIFNAQYSMFNIEGQVPWSSNGFYLTERPSFTSDPLFHAGAYYVQEASSMFLEEAIKQTVDVSKPLKILDLCAAPGGKSTLIQSLLNAASFLVSNEVIKTRVTVLEENISKWGAANVVVTNNDPKDFQRLPGYFDVIVVDAPCSGSGLFRKDAAAISEWSENNVLLCSQRQQRIIADVLPALKEGGVLLYSTCSYSAAEDEAVADWLLQEGNMESLQLHTVNSWGIVETVSPVQHAHGYRFYPDKVKGEGFFIAAFKKKRGSAAADPYRKPKNKTAVLPVAELAAVRAYIKNPETVFFTKQQEMILALPLCLQDELPVLQAALYIKKAGVTMGTVIRNELIPAHELAVSQLLHTSVTAVEVDGATALQYLRRQDCKIETAVRGWALLVYRNLPLGWVKILPNRINNYYPPAWRIVNK